jgi:tetratricopeptide (TPR) repeat protein
MRFSEQTRLRIAVAVVVVIAAISIGYKERVFLDTKFEDVMLLISPSAERAYSYASKHFDARDPQEYDVDRAYELFTLTQELDPAFPTVYHQLGRIEFLRGNLKESLALLDKEFATNPDALPSSYYVRALIKGYLKDYLGAAADYESYFKVTSANWGSINDYAWVLMKAGFQPAALEALNWGLAQWPGNAWLLNNKAIALYELKRYKEAYETALLAKEAIALVTEQDWYIAYPGNDPKVAATGLASFKVAAEENFEKMRVAAEK